MSKPLNSCIDSSPIPSFGIKKKVFALKYKWKKFGDATNSNLQEGITKSGDEVFIDFNPDLKKTFFHKSPPRTTSNEKVYYDDITKAFCNPNIQSNEILKLYTKIFKNNDIVKKDIKLLRFIHKIIFTPSYLRYLFFNDIQTITNLYNVKNICVVLMKLEIKKGEPWVMWPDLLVGNFNDYPANKIFDHKGDYVFTIEFELVEQITDKVCLFSKLPSYFGVDLRNGGITLTYSEKDKETDYIDANYNWLIDRKYELKIEKKEKNVILTIDKFQIFNFKIENFLITSNCT